MLRSHRQGGTATGNVLVGCASTEALSLAHRWPLLAAGQDPASLEARVAYHLRRIGIRWRDLRATALMPRDENAKLVQGRLALSQALVLELAAPSPTIRALTPASPTRGRSLGLLPRQRTRPPARVAASAGKLGACRPQSTPCVGRHGPQTLPGHPRAYGSRTAPGHEP